jgi:hypothetical protein
VHGRLYKGLQPLWGRQIPYTMMKFASFERVVEYIYSQLPKPKHEYGKLVQTEVLPFPLSNLDPLVITELTAYRFLLSVDILLESFVLSSPIPQTSWSRNSILKDKLVNQLVAR